MIVAVAGQDCATKLRLRYLLPQPVDLGFLQGIPEGQLQIHEFSKFVAGALDHFKLLVADEYLVTGSLGGRVLEITYWKERDSVADRSLRMVEKIFEAAGMGSVKYVKRRSRGDRIETGVDRRAAADP